MKISELVGKQFDSVEEDGDVYFRFADGDGYRLYHQQDCCERVYCEDVVGDLSDLTGTPIVSAEEIDSDERELPDMNRECEQWTFYRIRTIKGTVTLRFYGDSNGYYSTSVSFGEI